MRELKTKRNYDFGEVVSAMQKAIRRADVKLAGYWAIELFESGFVEYLWRRLYTISAEDCWGVITKEIEALHNGFILCNAKHKYGEPWKSRIFISKAVILLAMCKKCRDADHLTNLVYDKANINQNILEQELEDSRKNMEKIPEYAFDVHTYKGKKEGATKNDFFVDEFLALKPRQMGLLDGCVEAIT